MPYQLTLDIQYVDDRKVVFRMTRPAGVKTLYSVMGGMLATALTQENGGELRDWWNKISVINTNENQTFKDRLSRVDFDSGEGWEQIEYTLRFFDPDRGGLFKKQPDGSYAASFDDLFGRK